MKPSPLLLSLFAACALGACTRPNPAVCCLDQADCDEVGIAEVRGCAEGLACVEHQCTVPSCAEAGCGASAPVCNIVTDVCDPCTDSSECSRFTDTPVCELGSGGCVQCLASTDCAQLAITPVCETASMTCVQCLGPSECSGTKPICDANACRAPMADSECPSGAMADDGACVPESEVVYLDANGTDVGSCNRAVPCKTVPFAVSKTTAGRNHIVFAPGQYFTAEEVYDSSDTPAPSIYLHGHGAEILGPLSGDGCVMYLAISFTIRDTKVTTRNGGSALCIHEGLHVLERIETSGTGTGIQVSGTVTIRQFKDVTSYLAMGVGSTGALTLDRAVIGTGGKGIVSYGAGSLVQVSNALIYGTKDRALDFVSGTSGTISSTTIVTSGAAFSDVGARAAACPSTVLLRSSIVWSPGTTAAPMAGCSATNVIAGPVNVGGTTNSDPLFVNSAQNDYHLGAGSPARDAVDSGPATDFEGNPRPLGARFDIGADEAAP